MKKTFFPILLAALFSAFTPAVPGKELAGYKLRYDQVFSLRDYNLWVITNESSFDHTFVAIDAAVPRPCFGNELVLAAKVETENNSYHVTFKKVVVEKEVMQVYLAVDRRSEKRDNDSTVSLISWTRPKGLQKVNFYHGNLLVKSVPLVEVY